LPELLRAEIESDLFFHPYQLIRRRKLPE